MLEFASDMYNTRDIAKMYALSHKLVELLFDSTGMYALLTPPTPKATWKREHPIAFNDRAQWSSYYSKTVSGTPAVRPSPKFTKAGLALIVDLLDLVGFEPMPTTLLARQTMGRVAAGIIGPDVKCSRKILLMDEAPRMPNGFETVESLRDRSLFEGELNHCTATWRNQYNQLRQYLEDFGNKFASM